MKITFEHEALSVTIEDKECVSIYAAGDMCRAGLIGISFDPEVVSEVIPTEEEYGASIAEAVKLALEEIADSV